MLQQTKHPESMMDASRSQQRPGAPRQEMKNDRVEQPVTPASGCETEVEGQWIKSAPKSLDAQFGGIFHQNPKNRRMQVKVQMAIDVIQWQAGGAESRELFVNFGAQLVAQRRVEKVAESDRGGAAAEVSLLVDQPWNARWG